LKNTGVDNTGRRKTEEKEERAKERTLNDMFQIQLKKY